MAKKPPQPDSPYTPGPNIEFFSQPGLMHVVRFEQSRVMCVTSSVSAPGSSGSWPAFWLAISPFVFLGSQSLVSPLCFLSGLVSRCCVVCFFFSLAPFPSFILAPNGEWARETRFDAVCVQDSRGDLEASIFEFSIVVDLSENRGEILGQSSFCRTHDPDELCECPSLQKL